MAAMFARDADLPGYAIGGLAGGEDKISFVQVVACCTARLPPGKPRYLMGVGYPLDLVVCSALGVDMFDCVYPTRTGRFGTAMVPTGLLKLKNAAFASDDAPLDAACECFVCARYRRSYLHALLKSNAALGSELVTYHNLAYLSRLMLTMRASVIDGSFPAFVRRFLRVHFGVPAGEPLREACPGWVQWALDTAGVDLAGSEEEEEGEEREKNRGAEDGKGGGGGNGGGSGSGGAAAAEVAVAASTAAAQKRKR